MEFKKAKPYLLILAGFIIAGAVGYSAGTILFEDSEEPSETFSQSLDTRVDAENPVARIEFDGRSMQVLHEDMEEAKFFIEVTGDNRPDRDLNITRDGSTHRKNILATIDEKTYQFEIEYRDNATNTGDAYIEFLKVEALE